MLMIRLQRIGKRGQAYFRVVVVEHTKKTKGEFLELLGSYNPHQKELHAKKERIDYWVSKGAQPSPTVNNLLINHKIWGPEHTKVQSWKPKKKEAKPEEVKTEKKQEAPAPVPAPEEKESTPETPAVPEAPAESAPASA